MPFVIIKADELVYPTLVELKNIKSEMPQFKTFDFPNVEYYELLNNIGDMEDVARGSSLFWWNHCLVNRIGNLNHAYKLVLVYYNRGLPNDLKDYRCEHYVNRAQFGYLLAHPDGRPSISGEQGRKVYRGGTNKKILLSELLGEIKKSMLCMTQFIDALHSLIKPSIPRHEL